MNRTFIFLYLNTGSGHITAAKVLKQAMEQRYPDVSVRMINGFDRKNRFGKLVFEYGYGLSCNYFHGLFPLVYDLAQHRFFQTLFAFGLSFHIPRYLRDIIIGNYVTDVVSFHFALTPPLKKAVRRVPWHVNVTEIVTDPFNGPHSWFYERDQHFLVYSEMMKNMAVRECGIRSENIKVIPFLMNGKFRIRATTDEIRALRLKHGFDPDRKIVLLAGGGEGLPGAVEIINQCLFHRADFAVAVVCGRDKAKKHMLDVLHFTYPKFDLHVFGYVDFMDELIKLCDCAVIKAGPATLMEVLVSRKPVIICKYIHNQELENVRYAVAHHVGWFVQRPRDIYRKIDELLNGSPSRSMEQNFDSVDIDTDAGKAADQLIENRWPE